MRIRFLLALAFVFGMAAVFWAARFPSWWFKRRPNVVVILMDTTRADHLGFYGYERDTSPSLDKFAKENLAFRYAISAAPWTPPSVASIFSGLYVTSHGLMPPNSREEAMQASSKLHSEVQTLAEIFKKAGYQTAAVSPNPWITDEFGFAQGFDLFHYLARERASTITVRGMKLIEKMVGQDAPFFIYLHYLDPHDPYAPPEEYRKLYGGQLSNRSYPASMLENIGLYDGEIKYLDTALGKFFAFLKEKGLYDDLVMVIVGDHGEQFLERGNEGHGFQLFNEEVRVPLFIKAGNKKISKLIETPVSTIDIFPTLMSLTGLATPAPVQGISLLDFDAIAERAGVFSEISRKYQQQAIISSAGKKLIFGSQVQDQFVSADKVQQSVVGLYDMTGDVLELAAQSDAELSAQLREEFNEIQRLAISLKIQGTNKSSGVSEETIKQLESLGYLK